MRVALQGLVDEFKAREGEGPWDDYHFILIGPGGIVQEHKLSIDHCALSRSLQHVIARDLIEVAQDLIDRIVR